MKKIGRGGKKIGTAGLLKNPSLRKFFQRTSSPHRGEDKGEGE
jgi:hypothetical protein